MMRYISRFAAVFVFFMGCGLMSRFETPHNPDVYHVGSHAWAGDTIVLRIYRTSEPAANPSLPTISVVCASCNEIERPIEPLFDAAGNTRVFFPEVRNALSARVHVHGHGIDTTFIQKQRSPDLATQYYHLAPPLVGRVLVSQLAMLYSDTTQDSILTTAQLGDEVNIFGEQGGFYRVHHPLFPVPVYLLKSNAVRLD